MPRDDLRLLSIFHYVLAGLSALFALLPLVYVGLGALFVSGVLFHDEPNPPPPAMGWLFIAFGAIFFLVVVAWVVLLVLAGRNLARQRSWTFCVVVAALSCASVPLGTILGVFTLVTLNRPEVKATFLPARQG